MNHILAILYTPIIFPIEFTQFNMKKSLHRIVALDLKKHNAQGWINF